MHNINSDFENDELENDELSDLSAYYAYYTSSPVEADKGLFIGPAPMGAADARFKRIVNLCEMRYRVRDNVVVINAMMDDNHIIPPRQFLYDLADTVNDWRKHNDVLVHCAAGLNRSGLIVALALIRAGATPAQAIAKVRAARGTMALCNTHFEAWLRALPAPFVG